MSEYQLSSILTQGRVVHMASIGCGGARRAFTSRLPYLHHAMRALGLQGPQVTLMDGDLISETNCVRQPFSRGEVGLHKSIVLASRLNQFWGLNWVAAPEYLTDKSKLNYDIVVGCVDTRNSRKLIHNLVTGKNSFVRLWLDIGNDADSGQFVLGQPLNGRNKPSRERLRTVSDLYPEVTDFAEEKPGDPSCSALEALTLQPHFVNQALAAQALALLSRLFWPGSIDY